MALRILFISVAILASHKCDGDNKQWTKTWDLDSQDNWEGRKLPCGGKAAILPRRPTNPIFLGGRLTTSSLDLPVDGELIFGESANLVLDESLQLEQCLGWDESTTPDTNWDRHGHDSWWDPDAWHQFGFDDSPHSPVPHVHRVPCPRDSVSFENPNQSLYSVHLSPPPITVSSLTIGGQYYSTSRLAAYARTEEGQFRFVGVSSQSDNAPMYVERPDECYDITGCLCGTKATASKICRIMKPKCPPADCGNPIKMKGFCCEVCGAEIIISHNGSLPLASVKNLLKDHLLTEVAQNVAGHVSKMDDDFYHVFFTPENDQGDFQAAASDFKTKFEKELNNRGRYVTSLAYSGNPTAKARKGPSANSVAVAFITLAICLAIGLAYYYLKKRRVTTQLSFMFRRLESSSRRVSVVSNFGGRRSSTTSSILSPSYSREGGLRFQNPIFNQSLASLERAGVSDAHSVSVPVPEENEEGEHENPMYTAYEKMSPEERQASEDTLQAKAKREKMITSSVIEQDVISPVTSKPELDVIPEEKYSTDEPDEKSQTEKEVIDPKEAVKKPEETDDTKLPTETEENEPCAALDGAVNVESLLNIDPGSTEPDNKENSSLSLDVNLLNSLEEAGISDEVETEWKKDETTGGDEVSVSSSSDDNLDLAMDIEGFVPLKDMK